MANKIQLSVTSKQLKKETRTIVVRKSITLLVKPEYIQYHYW